MTTKRLGDLVPMFDDDSAEMDQQVLICGERHGIYECDEPYWMGEHTWHHDGQRFEQWCSCGNDHHYAHACAAVVALQEKRAR